MTHRTFQIPPAEGEPITFDLAGRKFECLPRAPLAARLLVTRAFTGADQVEFVRMVLVSAEQVADLDALLADRDLMVPHEVMVEVFDYLTEEYGERQLAEGGKPRPAPVPPAETAAPDAPDIGEG